MHAKSSKVHAATKHCRLRGEDWWISELMLDRAIDAINRRITVVRRYDVPYLAGYSVDGKTIYIDKDLPTGFHYRGEHVGTDRYLVLHEAVEKSILLHFGLKYQHAHQIALRAEQAAVHADGITWTDYDAFMQECIKEAAEDRSMLLPPDLDLTPYVDEHDDEILVRMRAAMAKDKAKESAKRSSRKATAAKKR
jgi:hypothetical protein